MISFTPAELRHEDRGGPAQPLLIVENLRKHFAIRTGGAFSRSKAAVRAVDGVSFQVGKGETLGIVGESGCGKSTVARLLMQLMAPDDGTVIFDGDAVGALDGITVKQMRRQMQMVFQDSYSSINPRLPIRDTISFAPHVHGMPKAQAHALADGLLEKVGLDPRQFGDRYPHQLSGGQRQRVNIARALALSPRLVVLDEAVSALDKSVEAQVLNLLADLKQQLALTYIFISHDLNVVQFIADRVLVMYLGRVMEVGPVDEIYARPRHPYTSALLGSRLSMDPDERMAAAPLSGDPPNPVDPPSGCRFRTRCPFAEEVCARQAPASTRVGDGHEVACLMADPASGHSRAGTTAREAVPC